MGWNGDEGWDVAGRGVIVTGNISCGLKMRRGEIEKER